MAVCDRVRLGKEARSRIQRLYGADALARRTAEALLLVSPQTR
jgi:hypothetical protein